MHEVDEEEDWDIFKTEIAGTILTITIKNDKTRAIQLMEIANCTYGNFEGQERALKPFLVPQNSQRETIPNAEL
ncbi:MAG: hypothetical protein ACI9XO_002160 [Paraglaciecola sp.]